MSLPQQMDINDAEENDTDNEEVKAIQKTQENKNIEINSENTKNKSNTIQLFNSAAKQKSESQDSDDNLFGKSDDSSEKDVEMEEEEEIKLSNISSFNEEHKNKEAEILELLKEILKNENLKFFPNLHQAFQNMSELKSEISFFTIYQISSQLDYSGEEEEVNSEVRINLI